MQLILFLLRWLFSKFATVIIIVTAVVLLAVAWQHVRQAERKVRALRLTEHQLTDQRTKRDALDLLETQDAAARAGHQQKSQALQEAIRKRLAEAHGLQKLKLTELKQREGIQALRKEIAALERQAQATQQSIAWMRRILDKGQKLLDKEYKTEHDRKIERRLALQRQANQAKAKMRHAEEALTETIGRWKQEKQRLESRKHDSELARLEAEEHALQSRLAILDKDAESRAKRRAVHEKEIARLDQQGREQWAEVRVYALFRQQCADAFRRNRMLIATLILGILLGPLSWSAVWYYGIARLTKLSSPLRFYNQPRGRLMHAASAKLLDHDLARDGVITARMEWVQRYPAEAEKKTRFLWSWKAPFTSFASGLVEMTEITPAPTGSQHVELCAGDDPDMQLMRIELHNHSGLVLRPSQLIALAGDVQLRTRWTLMNAHAWVSGSLRHILFTGTGVLYVRGRGGVVAHDIDGQHIRLEEARVSGYDAALQLEAVRTETFWPYFRRRTSLFDLAFTGDGLVLYHKSVALAERRASNPVVRVIDTILRTIGKVLGI